ncbi:bacterial regulatory, Fis family protein [Edwardsiella tarda]|nr:bacterial regulatory, Fis family protein [Edwardsiella tarda]
MMLLKRYRWPGNVRELSNLMEYLINVVPSGEVIDTALLPPNLVNGQVTPVYREDNSHYQSSVACDDHGSTALEEMEKQMIREALSRHSNKKQAAEELGIGIATLYRKIKKYELTTP